MSDKLIPEDWWPSAMQSFSQLDIENTEMITVAEFRRAFKNRGEIQMFTILVPPRILSTAAQEKWSPDWFPWDYYDVKNGTLLFRSSFGKSEILVAPWEAAQRIVLNISPDFLYRMDLIPRIVKENGVGKLFWDDLQKPQYGVIEILPTSDFHFHSETNAYVRIDKSYLQRYATMRKKAIVQVYFVYYDNTQDEDIKMVLGQKKVIEIRFANRLILVKYRSDLDEFSCEIHGYRVILQPERSIRSRFDDIDPLEWPGHPRVKMTRQYHGSHMAFEYIRDTVLEEYENDLDTYELCPESGAVSLGNQWGVSYCDRVERDLIRIEVGKLYEGCPEHVIKHWHAHAVKPPNRTDYDSLNTPNISKRAMRLIYGWFMLGRLLSEFISIISQKGIKPEEIIGYDPVTCKHKGLWSERNFCLIALSSPLNMGKDTFLIRCQYLNETFASKLKEKELRKILIDLGADANEIAKIKKSLGLLNAIILYVIVADKTGLNLLRDFKDIEERRKEIQPNFCAPPYFPTPLRTFFMLNDFRQEAAHLNDIINELLAKYDIDSESLKSGWGLLLDKFYDGLGGSLDEINHLLSQICRNIYCSVDE